MQIIGIATGLMLMIIIKVVVLSYFPHRVIRLKKKKLRKVEMPGIEPGASYMQSMRSTTELHPHTVHSVVPVSVLIHDKDSRETEMFFNVLNCTVWFVLILKEFHLPKRMPN